MSTEANTATETPSPAKPAKPVKRRRRRTARRAPAEERPAQARQAGPNFAGMTATTCPDACTATACIISTVGVCKHPHKAGDSGCGPVTMANREKAKRYLKRQKAE